MLSTPSSADRPDFVIANYQDGVLIDVPAECPWRSRDGPCDVGIHCLRSRKTGPSHPLAVCRCRAHDAAFTAYPPGFVPYARRALLTTLDGGTTAANDAVALADVARDAAGGTAWPRSAPGGSSRWWPTQTRLLDRLGSIFGAFEGQFVQEAISLALHLPLHLLAHLTTASGYRSRGAALLAVLEHLQGDLDRLLLAGAMAGVWGAPWRWESSPPRLRPLVPPHLRDLSKRSTTSGPRAPPSLL